MYTLPIIASMVANVLLTIACLWLFYPQIKESINKRKKMQENKANKERALEKANLVKTIRYEVRRYLEELQNE